MQQPILKVECYVHSTETLNKTLLGSSFLFLFIFPCPLLVCCSLFVFLYCLFSLVHVFESSTMIRMYSYLFNKHTIPKVPTQTQHLRSVGATSVIARHDSAQTHARRSTNWLPEKTIYIYIYMIYIYIYIHI